MAKILIHSYRRDGPTLRPLEHQLEAVRPKCIQVVLFRQPQAASISFPRMIKVGEKCPSTDQPTAGCAPYRKQCSDGIGAACEIIVHNPR